VFDIALKYPIAFVFNICLLLFLTAGIFFGSDINDYEISYLILTFFLSFSMDKPTQKIVFFIFVLCGFVIHLLLDLGHPFILFMEYVFLSLFIYLRKEHNNIFIFGIIAAAFILHLYYIQNTPVNIRQHDLNGILFYMQRITENGINWRGFDPWYMYYFFHQPLHFIINGYIAEITDFLWDKSKLTEESLQYISLFYVTASSIIALGIFKELKFSIKNISAALILFSFNPTLTLFSGYISDDVPTLFWSLLFIYFLLLWYNEKGTKYLMFAAVSLGFGVLTKLSILMLIPATVYLFAYKLYRSDNKKEILQQISYFIIIAVPLALIWIIRNHVFYDMPFYNIPDTSPGGQNFKYFGIWERIGNFSLLSFPFLKSSTINEPNIFLSIIKTELFGEWNFGSVHSFIYFYSLCFYALNIILKAMAAIGVFVIVKKNISHITAPLLCFFVIIYLTIWGYAINYALKYPYICSADFRLFSQLIITESVILTFLAGALKKDTALFVIITIYAVLSSFIYIGEI